MTESGPRCSTESLVAGESLAGSAPTAIGWVALEQSGPWGAKAFTASHLDPGLGRDLESLAAAHDVRPCLVRRPGRHADDHHDVRRRLLVAHTVPGSTWLLSGDLDDPAGLLALDWAALRDGDLSAVIRSLPGLAPLADAQLLVCTNGTRDACCALVGRPVAADAAASFPGRVWEVTHTSGHRFAPTAVLLPHGTLHGRLDPRCAADLLEAADRGETVLTGNRGRSTWAPVGQVAELAVRADVGELGLDALTVSTQGATAVVRHVDGRTWRVVTEPRDAGLSRRESCAKPALPMTETVVVSVTAEPR